MRKLIGGTVAVGAVYAALRIGVGDRPAPTDPYVLLLAGVALGGVLATLVYPFRPWTLRRVGMLFVFGAFALFSIGTFWISAWGMDPRAVERLEDLILALLVVGSPLLIVGVLAYQVGLVIGRPYDVARDDPAEEV